MAPQALADVLRFVRHLAGEQEGGEQSDTQLLRRFVARRDQGAFTALLQRHGPLVFRVCRQVLHDSHAAEDAFQATFLVLARKAASIRKHDALAAWLHRVAVNIARTASTSAAQRRAHERQAIVMAQVDAAREAALRDWQPLVHAEVDRLPEKYRVPVVLCYLEGKSHDEAARQLGWPLGTVKGRLARARDLLRTGLTRRGLALSAGGLAAALDPAAALGHAPTALLGYTLHAAVSFARGGALPTGAASANALALARGALQTTTMTKLACVLALVLAVGLIGIGAAWGLGRGHEAKPEAPSAVVDKARPQERGATPGKAEGIRPQADSLQLSLTAARKAYRIGEPIDLTLTIKNSRKEDFSCLRSTLQNLSGLAITGPDGKPVAPTLNPVEIEFGNGLVVVGPGQAAAFADELRWINQPKAPTGRYLRHTNYPMDVPGTYRLRYRLADATSNEATIEVLGQKGVADSRAVRVNQVDFQTAVEEKCSVPPPGGKQQLYLGLRITNGSAKPLLVNVYDTLRPVVAAADGTALPTQWGQRLRSFVPAPVLVQPGKTETVQRCPTLEWLPDGKTLRLRGPDGAGGFWFVEGLRPGKYLIHFEYENTADTQAVLLRSLPLRAAEEQLIWMGKVVTRAAAFAIVPPPKQREEVPNFPAALQASEPANVKALVFQTLTNSVWPAPGPGGLSPLQLQLRVSNRGKDNMRFLPILGTPVMTTVDGKPLKAQLHGNDHIRRLPNPTLLEPGKAVTATELARLFRRDKGLSLYWEDEGGSVWSYDGLQPGKYLLSLHYKSTGPSGTWAGEASTKAVTIEIRELHASAPVVVNQLEVSALADATWPVPAAGKQSLIALGFRVTKVKQPTWARIFPRIAAVQAESADGRVHPVKKVATGLPGWAPQALHMNPDVSRTLAEPATLSRTGQLLALTWADSEGNVWQIEGLRPGRHTVSYVIHADKGKTPEQWTTWTGEVQTAAVEVTIKE
jgi:RNA polymerase sigma factor (sigma-70 family)